jgi:hypothetical protein
MRRLVLITAVPLAAALLPATASAQSAASAALSFTALAASGFAWIDNPGDPSNATSTVAAADFAAWVADPFGDFVPTYGMAGSASLSVDGLAVPVTGANTVGTVTYASAYTFTAPGGTQASLQAATLVPVAGQGNATAFARSWFSLAPGASVTFQGALFLSVSGERPALPANFITTDFYGYASALMASGALLQQRETGNPLAAYAAGPYAFNDVGLLTLTVSNPGPGPLVSFLDTGVSVYSASPVPEPGTYALLLAGLAAVVFVARRRG